MYLKKTPIVDLQNEILLHIIFSILNFTEREKQELKDHREELPLYVVDQSKTKKAKKEKEAKKVSAAASQSQQSNGSQEGDQKNSYFSKNEIKDKMKQGMIGLFRRDNSKASRTNELSKQNSGNKYI